MDIKKNLLFGVVIAAIVALSACSNNGSPITTKQLDGEWEAVWIYDIDSITGEIPFIGFDTKVEGLYGSTGCNRLMGTYKLENANLCDCNILEFNQIGSTRMMCENMAVEKSILTALNNAAYCSFYKGTLQILDKDKAPLLKLQKRLPIKSISGHWEIVSICSLPVDSLIADSIETYMNLDIHNMRLNANAGCNIINSNIQQKSGNDYSLEFSSAISTMMSCPDMRMEQHLLKAINTTRAFKICTPDSLILTDGNGNETIILTR